MPTAPEPPAPARLTVSVADEPGTRCLELFGELDLGTAPDLREALADAAASPAGTVVLDLSAVSFMDSTGLRDILRAHEQLEGAGKRLALVRGPRAVDRVFRITGADRVLSFLD